MTEFPFDQRPGRSRVERRRAVAEAKRRRARRQLLIWTTVSIILVVLGVGGWLIYRFVVNREPPQPVSLKIVIPEGLTIEQTAERVQEGTEGNISKADFIRAAETGEYDYPFLEGTNGNLEGFLFPKTYEVTTETSAGEVVDMLLEQFEKETEGLDWGRAQSLGVSRYQVVIIASMVEREVKIPEERPVVASVIYNRLNGNMKLAIDATVQYALGEWKPALSNEDLEVDSPYNTYKIEGLPPAPICSPGFESIRAALHPDETDYIYFLVTSPDEGRHSFTADYEQFLIWKQEQNENG